MRLVLAGLAFSVAALSSASLAQAPAPIQIVDYAELRDHEVSSAEHSIPTEWQDAPSLAQQTYGGSWTVRLVVDETGAVVSAQIDPRHSASGHREDVRNEALRLRFRRFERDGRAVRAAFAIVFTSTPADYVGPPDRSFPDDIDMSQVRIRFERTPCYGTCPSYQVEIDGDGNVVYRGVDSVLARGEHRWIIPQSSVRDLLGLFRRADYFRLHGYYRVNASDLPTYITGLEIGGQRKFVLNYGWSGMGGAVASTSFGGSEGGPMPPIESEIEQAIDRLSGVQAYVEGDETSVDRLRAEHWNFRSADNGGAALAKLIGDCKLSLAQAFLSEGAPLISQRGRERGFQNQPAVLLTPRCGDLGFVRELVNRGALGGRATADAFLRAAVSSGYPDIVALALQHSHNFTQGDEGGILNDAVMAYEDEDNPNHDRFSEEAVVRLLLEAGADPRARDPLMGDTPLHHASSAEEARLLIGAGADPNARDAEGRTPLFNAYFPEVFPVLIEAGANINARDDSGYTALYVANSPEAIRALVALRADPNDVAPDGKTPIEVVGNEESMQALLDAGAHLPAQRERIAAILAHTAYWDALPPALAQRADELGLSRPTPESRH